MSEITKAIQFICDEKGLTFESVMEAIEAAMSAAYRKDFGNRQQNVKVKFDPETMGMEVWDEKEVVEDIDEEILLKAQEELTKRREEAQKEGRELTEEEMADLARFNPKMQIMITQAKEQVKKAKVGEIIKIKLEVPGEFGRMAAQTAKQVVIQRLREAERNTVYDELKDQVGNIIHGIVQRRDRAGAIIIDLGKATATLPAEEQIYGEQYRPGARMRFLIEKVEMGQRGLEIILSRAGKKMVETIFAEEIPEIGSGAVEIKGLARDAGHRSKVAVWTGDDSIDPIGACIGQRGSRITTIIEGLGGEKIDVIQFSDDAAEYIKHALSPAKVTAVSLNEETKEAAVYVAADQFSLAIGRGGQNVRLAAELTGWKLNVVQNEGEEKIVSSDDVVETPEAVAGEEEKVVEEEKKSDES
ncbi:MAG: transcription termination factor NusA [Candidatus Magasanikbacteria bacterium]|nr:transcription termination factor NusA [Candidatus Magasanikbacteria bacterium]